MNYKKFNYTPYLFLAPALILTLVFVVYPFFSVAYYSFTDFDIITAPKWIGLQNYTQMVTEDTFWISLRNSFVYLVVTPIIIVLSVILAIVVNRKIPAVGAFRALYYIPVITGTIATGVMWRWMFDGSNGGLVNGSLLSLGIIDKPVTWLYHQHYTLLIAMLLTIWTGVGYYMVVFLAGLQSIPEEIYDAAMIDGCNNFQKHWYVSIPGLRPTITFVAVISSLAALRVFNEIYVLTDERGGLLNSAYTIVFYIYKEAFSLQHVGYASAVAMVLLAITMIFSVINVRVLERGQD